MIVEPFMYEQWVLDGGAQYVGGKIVTSIEIVYNQGEGLEIRKYDNTFLGDVTESHHFRIEIYIDRFQRG